MKNVFTKVFRIFYHFISSILSVICDCRLENKGDDLKENSSHKEDE